MKRLHGQAGKSPGEEPGPLVCANEGSYGGHNKRRCFRGVNWRPEILAPPVKIDFGLMRVVGKEGVSSLPQHSRSSMNGGVAGPRNSRAQKKLTFSVD